MPSPVKPANSISATSFGFDPGPVLALARRVLAAERALVGLERIELFEKPAGVAGIEARADLAGMHKVIAAINADHERAQVAGAAAPAADDDFMAGAALGLHPAFRAARLVGRARAL